MVYADDTTIVCQKLEDLKLVIKLIERFCAEYDITINVNKTKWMRFGPQYSTEIEEINLNGQLVEKVRDF